MPSLKDLRNRIQSVKNTRQITKTMKMVAAAKVRRARNTVDESLPYAERMEQTMRNLAHGLADAGPLMLNGRDDIKAVRLIVFGSDRGLCGGLNSNVIKEMVRLVNEHQAQKRKVQIVAVGRKVRDGARRLFPDLLIAQHVDVMKEVSFQLAEDIGFPAMEAFEAAECDLVQMIYPRCVSMINQVSTVMQLIPFGEHDYETYKPFDVKYEPGIFRVFEYLLPKSLKTQVYRALIETVASEHAARMTAMDSATRNAGEMIKKLSLEYNRSRQAAITKELIEIISGAEAV